MGNSTKEATRAGGPPIEEPKRCLQPGVQHVNFHPQVQEALHGQSCHLVEDAEPSRWEEVAFLGNLGTSYS